MLTNVTDEKFIKMYLFLNSYAFILDESSPIYDIDDVIYDILNKHIKKQSRIYSVFWFFNFILVM